MLTLSNLMAVLPLIIVASTAILVMLGIAWRRHHGGTAVLSAAGLVLALATAPLASTALSSPPLMTLDGLAQMGTVLVLLCALVTVA